MQSMTHHAVTYTAASPDPATDSGDGGAINELATSFINWLIKAAPETGAGWRNLAIGAAIVLATLYGMGHRRNEAKGKKERPGFNGVADTIGEGIAAVIGGVFKLFARFLSGRPLWGEPKSDATFLRSGTAPLTEGGVPVAGLGAVAAVGPRVSREKTEPNPLLLWCQKRAVAALERVDAYEGRGQTALEIAGACLVWIAEQLGRIARWVRTGIGGVWFALKTLWPVLTAVTRTLSSYSRWARLGVATARVLPLAALLLWLLNPAARAWLVLGLVLVPVAVIALAVTGPNGMALWHGRTVGDDETIAPRVWLIVRPMLRLEETEFMQSWLDFPTDISAEGARIVLRLPMAWLGGQEQQNAIDHAVTSRLPAGQVWVSRFELAGAQPYAQWTHKPKPKPKPTLPGMVQWKPSADPLRVMLGETLNGPYYVDIGTATPHWGVCGGTNDGKTTCLLIPIVHARQHGAVVDALAPKVEAFEDIDPSSGVRIHKTVRSQVAAVAEFFLSMKSAETLPKNANGDRVMPDGTVLPHRYLVIDEWGGFVLAAKGWWKYGMQGKGMPPFEAWFHTILMQARSARHYVVVGAHQFSLAMFGSTDVRDLVGTKLAVGPASPSKKATTFPQMDVPDWESDVKGRGAVGITGAHEAEEIQIAYITPYARAYLSECAPAPEWFDNGEMAPWILDRIIAEGQQELLVGDFMPGGTHMQNAPALTPDTSKTNGVPNPRSEDVSGGSLTPSLTSGDPAGPMEAAEDGTPPLFTLRQACKEELGVLPIGYGAARERKSQCKKQDRDFPEGVSYEGITKYSRAELLEWWENEPNKPNTERV